MRNSLSELHYSRLRKQSKIQKTQTIFLSQRVKDITISIQMMFRIFLGIFNSQYSTKNSSNLLSNNSKNPCENFMKQNLVFSFLQKFYCLDGLKLKKIMVSSSKYENWCYSNTHSKPEKFEINSFCLVTVSSDYFTVSTPRNYSLVDLKTTNLGTLLFSVWWYDRFLIKNITEKLCKIVCPSTFQNFP